MQCEVIEVTAGIDWLTATLPAECPTGDLWVERSLTCLDAVAAEGYEHYERTMQGYGGISAGNCFVGSRYDGHIVQLTGHHANRHFDGVFRPDLHVSRIDVQMTVKYKVMPLDIARKAYDDATACNSLLPAKRRRKLTLITGSDGGDTTYIGAPSSEQRGRIYNKEVQSEDIAFKRTWRYEVVFRNDLSTRLAGSCPRCIDSRTKWAIAVAYDWFRRRGVDCGVNTNDIYVELPLQQTLPSDVSRKLQWLERQVAPTIKWLTARGYGDTIRSVLGLTDLDSSP